VAWGFRRNWAKYTCRHNSATPADPVGGSVTDSLTILAEGSYCRALANEHWQVPGWCSCKADTGI